LGSVPPGDQYAYLNQAYAFSQSLADAPPDYTYDYQGERPWVWESPDGYYRVAERLPMGVRYFYYAPGAPEPYLVQDPQYSYGYSDGRLTVVYGSDGQVLPYDIEARQAREAGLYLAWAAGLYAAARHEEHVAVSQDRWNAERQAVYADQARWNQAQQRNTAWATYSQAHENDQAHWANQRYVRAAEAARFAEAVNDRTALAHAQQAAVDARIIAQSHGERAPGPAPQGGFDRHAPGAPGFAPPGQPAGDLAGARRQQAFQRQQVAEPAAGLQDRGDRPPTPGPQAGFDRREPQAPPARAPGPAASELAAAHRQQALQHQQAAEQANAQVQARERAAMQSQAAADSQRQAKQNAVQGLAQAREAQARDQQAAARQAEAAAAGRAAADRAAVEAHRQAADQAQAQAQLQAQRNAQAAVVRREAQPAAHAEVPPATPHPQAPPAKGKPKPEEPPH
jgi:hypothetical protein